jgi:hypothetical protein
MDDARLRALSGSLPIDMDLGAPRPWVRWLDLRGIAIAEPMFSGTVKRAAGLGRQPRMSAPQALLEVADVADVVPPTAFVFHGARTGASLLAMALRELDDTIVLNEPQSTCMAIAHRGFDERAPWLPALVRCLGQRQTRAQRRLFVVFSSWAVLRLATIRRVFPEVPCVYLFRDPAEVVGSLLRHAPKWANPPRSSLDALVETAIIGDAHATMTDEEFFARAIGGFNAAAAAADVRAVDYQALARATPEQIASWCGVAITDGESARMRAALPELVRIEVDNDPAPTLQPLARDAVDRWATRDHAALVLRSSSAS